MYFCTEDPFGYCERYQKFHEAMNMFLQNLPSVLKKKVEAWGPQDGLPKFSLVFSVWPVTAFCIVLKSMSYVGQTLTRMEGRCHLKPWSRAVHDQIAQPPRDGTQKSFAILDDCIYYRNTCSIIYIYIYICMFVCVYIYI